MERKLSWLDRYMKARNTSSIVELEELASDDDFRIRNRVYFNKNCTKELRELINTIDRLIGILK